MSRQNRVDPFGRLRAVAERGTLTGNRGCLHDADGRGAAASHRWDFPGYSPATDLPPGLVILTPPSIVAALAVGYVPTAARA